MAARGPFGVLLQAQRRAQTSSRAFGDSREPANRALGFLYRKRRWLFYPLFVLAAVAVLAWWAYSPSLPAETLKARYTNSDSKFINIGGAEAHMRDQGNPDGVPLLLIHGAGGSLHEWEGWVDELKSKARLISVDLPGHGLTGAWPRNEYTVEAYADFIELLVDKLKLDRFAIAGHSLGGAVAWTFAARQPDRVTQIILVDAAGETREAPWPTRLARLPVVGDIGIYFKPERWVRRKLTEAYADPSMVTAMRVKRTAELQRFPGNREATLLRTRTQGSLDPAPLRRLAMPTLILWGAHDRWVSIDDAFRFLKDIRTSRLEIFEKLGHNPMEEDPKATAAAVARFLEPIPAWPSSPAAGQLAGAH